MLLLLNKTQGVDLSIIAAYLNINNHLLFSVVSNKHYIYFKKHLIANHIYEYLYLAKIQHRRPCRPSLYDRLCGADFFTCKKVQHKHIYDYKKSRSIFKLIKLCIPDKLSTYHCDSLLLINENYIRILNIIESNLNTEYENIDYTTRLYNYESLGVSPLKSHIFSNDGHDWYFHKKKWLAPIINYAKLNPHKDNRFIYKRWNDYDKWRNNNIKYAI